MTHIYILKHPTTLEIRYVGKTVDLKRRLYQHTSKSLQSKLKSHINNWLLQLINSGLKPVMEVIETCENWEEREKYWIRYYQDLECDLCNLCEGGKGINGYKKTEEQKKQQSIRFKGMNTWMTGKKFSQSTKNKMRQAKLGTIGKKHSEESKSKIRDKHNCKAVECTNIETGQVIEFQSVNFAAKSLNLNPSLIFRCLKGNSKKHKGWTFKTI